MKTYQAPMSKKKLIKKLRRENEELRKQVYNLQLIHWNLTTPGWPK